MGDECRCMHFVQRFMQGVMQWAHAFRDGISRIHLVHAFFLHVFLVFSSCISPRAHTFPPLHPQGRMEYLVKWKGWSQK